MLHRGTVQGTNGSYGPTRPVRRPAGAQASMLGEAQRVLGLKVMDRAVHLRVAVGHPAIFQPMAGDVGDVIGRVMRA